MLLDYVLNIIGPYVFASSFFKSACKLQIHEHREEKILVFPLSILFTKEYLLGLNSKLRVNALWGVYFISHFFDNLYFLVMISLLDMVQGIVIC